MKTLLIALFATSSLIATATGTKEKNVANYNLTKNFTAQFGYVDSIVWRSAMNNMTRAEFEIDHDKICAYFDEAGNYVAQTVEMDFSELPKNLQKAVEEKAPGAEIVSVFKMISNEETSWFVETNANNEHKLWKGNSFGKFTRYYVK